MKQKKRKSINLDSKVLIRNLKEIDDRIDKLYSEQEKWALERNISIDKSNEINRKINSIESNIHFRPKQIKIEDVKKLYHLYNEQKKYDQKFNLVENKQFDLGIKINKLTKARINLLVPRELLLDIDNRILRTYNREKKIDEDLREDPILFKIVTQINSDIVYMNRHNIVLNRKQVAVCIDNKFNSYKEQMKSAPYPIKITKRNYFEAVAPKVEIVKKNDWQPKQLYTDAIK